MPLGDIIIIQMSRDTLTQAEMTTALLDDRAYGTIS